MAELNQSTEQAVAEIAARDEKIHPALIIYSHSSLFYWWPVWVCGYIMALITFLAGEQYQVGGDFEYYHPSSNLGIIFFFTLFFVILSSNVTVRGLASGIVVLTALLVTVLLAYYDLWDTVLRLLGNLRIHLNLGAYFWFSTLLFLLWVFAFFIFDRLTYWRVKPGQITQEYVLGAAAKSYDTDNLVLQKFRDDLFRHWLLGLGAGDLVIHPYGANREQISIPNVLFIGRKIRAIQQMIATEPDKFGHTALE